MTAKRASEARAWIKSRTAHSIAHAARLSKANSDMSLRVGGAETTKMMSNQYPMIDCLLCMHTENDYETLQQATAIQRFVCCSSSCPAKTKNALNPGDSSQHGNGCKPVVSLNAMALFVVWPWKSWKLSSPQPASSLHTNQPAASLG